MNKKNKPTQQNDFDEQDEILDDHYDDYEDNQAVNNHATRNKILIGVAAVAAIGLGYFAYKNLTHHDEVLMAQIVAVTPNYSTIQIPSENCQNVVTNKKVKNPNRNFFNGIFDSKNHPEYVTQSSSKRVCSTSYTESQVLQNYTIQYQVKNVVESIITQQQPPAVGTMIPVEQLQMFINANESAESSESN